MKQSLNEPPSRAEAERAISDTLYQIVTLKLAEAVVRWIESDVTLVQLKALLVLSRRGDATLGELANELGTGNSAASILVQQMVTRGFVDRTEDASDRRRTVLCLTERGARLAAGQRKERETRLRRWLVPLPEQELQGLRHGLAILDEAIQEESVRPR